MMRSLHDAHADGPQNGSLSGRLDGWIKMAAYLGLEVRTAGLWERVPGQAVERERLRRGHDA